MLLRQFLNKLIKSGDHAQAERMCLNSFNKIIIIKTYDNTLTNSNIITIRKVTTSFRPSMRQIYLNQEYKKLHLLALTFNRILCLINIFLVQIMQKSRSTLRVCIIFVFYVRVLYLVFVTN